VRLEATIPAKMRDLTRLIPAETHSPLKITAIIIGGSVGLLFAICVILLLLYRMRKKDEGSYSVDDEKKQSNNYPYTQGQEYYA